MRHTLYPPPPPRQFEQPISERGESVLLTTGVFAAVSTYISKTLWTISSWPAPYRHYQPASHRNTGYGGRAYSLSSSPSPFHICPLSKLWIVRVWPSDRSPAFCLFFFLSWMPPPQKKAKRSRHFLTLTERLHFPIHLFLLLRESIIIEEAFQLFFNI
ncbi:hypothetical protein VTK73DRAFT_9755 [Phialemonium thermophilum]|uniref:Uncharacterized protein n=1 Tax=Phialemonium thermophilum TaxID=223376 RepID=A0ABR3W0G9_9PEZI